MGTVEQGRTLPRTLVTALLGLAGTTCTQAASPPSPPPQIAVARELPDAPRVPPPPEPVHVQALLHFKNPTQFAKQLELPGDEETPDESLPLDAQALVQLGLGDELASAVDLTAPVQLAFLEHKGATSEVACSLGLGQSAQGAASKPLDLESAPHCTRHDSATMGPRLVCSDSGSVSEGVLAVLERAANRRFTGDVLLELPSEVMARAREDTAAEPPPEDPEEAFGRELAQDFLGAIGSMALELSLDDTRAEVALELEVLDASGFLASLLVGDAPQAPLPFDGLPRDANVALSLSGLEPRAMAQAAEPVWQGFEAHLGRFDSHAQANAVVSHMRQLFLTGGPLLFASGPFPETKAQTPELPAWMSQRGLRGPGWWTVGVQEPLEHWTRGLEKMIEIDQKPTPPGAGEPVKERRTASPTVSFLRKYPTPGRAGLPKGTVHFRIWETANPDYVPAEGEKPPVESTTYVYATGKPPTTWIVGSEQDDLALAKARELVRGRDAGEHARYFAPRPAESARLVGFTTLQGLAELVLPDDSPWAALYLLGGFMGQSDERKSFEFPLHYSVVQGDPNKRARLEVEFPQETLVGMVRGSLSALMRSEPRTDPEAEEP